MTQDYQLQEEDVPKLRLLINRALFSLVHSYCYPSPMLGTVRPTCCFVRHEELN